MLKHSLGQLFKTKWSLVSHTNKNSHCGYSRNSTTLEVSWQRNCLGERFSLGSLGILWTLCTEHLLHTSYCGRFYFVGEIAKFTDGLTDNAAGRITARRWSI